MITTTLPATTTLGAAHLLVADLDRAVLFYTETLGLFEHHRDKDTAYLATGTSDPWLRLTGIPGARRKPQRSTGLYHIAILTPDRPALARSLLHLVEQRYPLQGASDHLVSEALYLADPDGNGLEIYRDRPRAEWPLHDGKPVMNTLHLDLDSLLAEGRADTIPWNGLQPATRLGHTHLHVADLDAAVRFYVGVLGFDEMLRFGDSAAFVSAGGYHHHIGLNTWAGVGAPPPPADAVGLRAFEVVLPDADARDRVRERLTAARIQFTDNDGTITVADPSHNTVLLRVA